METEQDCWFDFMTVPQAQLCIAEVLAVQACDKPQTLDASQWDSALSHLCQARPVYLPAIEKLINLVPSEGTGLKEVKKASIDGRLPKSTLLKVWQQQPQLLEEEILRVLWQISEEESHCEERQDCIGSNQSSISPRPQKNIWEGSSIYHIVNESNWVCSQVMDILLTVLCESQFSKVMVNALRDFKDLLCQDSWDLYKVFPSSTHHLLFLLSVPPYLYEEKMQKSVCKSGSNERITLKESYCHFVLMKLAKYIEGGGIEEVMILKSVICFHSLWADFLSTSGLALAKDIWQVLSS